MNGHIISSFGSPTLRADLNIKMLSRWPWNRLTSSRDLPTHTPQICKLSKHLTVRFKRLYKKLFIYYCIFLRNPRGSSRRPDSQPHHHGIWPLDRHELGRFEDVPQVGGEVPDTHTQLQHTMVSLLKDKVVLGKISSNVSSIFRADCSKADSPDVEPEHNGLTQFGRVRTYLQRQKCLGV